jgi:hypothetical protein
VPTASAPIELLAEQLPGAAVDQRDHAVAVDHQQRLGLGGDQLLEHLGVRAAAAQGVLELGSASALLLQAAVVFIEQAVLHAQVVLQRLDAQHRAHHVLQQGDVALDQERLAAGLVAAVQLVAVLHHAGDQHHRHPVAVGHGLQPAADLVAVDAAAQHHVHQEQVEAAAAGLHHAHRAGRGRDDLVSQVVEPALEQELGARFVFNDEDASHLIPFSADDRVPGVGCKRPVRETRAPAGLNRGAGSEQLAVSQLWVQVYCRAGEGPRAPTFSGPGSACLATIIPSLGSNTWKLPFGMPLKTWGIPSVWWSGSVADSTRTRPAGRRSSCN